jgi:ubiquinone/menaquinone biosynthesis C-methylase UbiE
MEDVMKTAFDAFVNKEYDKTKDIISLELDKRVNDYVKTELDLDKNIIDIPQEE